MYKALVLIGLTAAFLTSQGCGGKKEAASLPPHLASAAATPPTTIGSEDSSSRYNPNPPTGKGEDGYNPPSGQGGSGTESSMAAYSQPSS